MKKFILFLIITSAIASQIFSINFWAIAIFLVIGAIILTIALCIIVVIIDLASGKKHVEQNDEHRSLEYYRENMPNTTKAFENGVKKCLIKIRASKYY